MTFHDSCGLLSYKKVFSIFIKNTKNYRLSVRRLHMDTKNEAKSVLDVAKIPPIVSIYRLAVQTFNDKSKDFESNFNKLKTMMSQLKPEHFAFDKTLSDPSTWKKPKKAPCTYIQVFQNSQITMSIFVLKPGFTLPLHDHPHMHGLLKVISGAVRIRTFSEYPLDKNVNVKEFEKTALKEAQRLSDGKHKKRKLYAQVNSDRVCSANTETCSLTPTISNYHEIQALEMPAAFFDILSPPYDTFIHGIGPRRCHYYKVNNEISTNVVELEEVDVPECFYCDQAPYLGPTVS